MSFLRWRQGKVTVSRYWEFPAREDETPEREEIIERVDAALRESVRRQLVADVPLGAFLSGGIDSGLMVHYMTEAGAELVARAHGCRHHVLQAPQIDGAAFAGAIQALDQPLADPACVVTSARSALTRKHVTVAISGDGGDELFGGYLAPEALGRARPEATLAWREAAESVLARCETLAPFLRADSVRALWKSAQGGRGSRRLAYAFVVLLLWLEKHPLRC